MKSRRSRSLVVAGLLGLLAATTTARAEDAPVDIPAAWREHEAALGLPPPLPGYVEEQEGNVRFLLPERAFSREARAVRDALPAAWKAVSEDVGIDFDPPLQVRLALNPAHLRALSPEHAPAPEFAVGVAYPSAGIVIVSLTAEAPATDLDPISVLTHELSHVALRIKVGGHPLPRWFVEGVAIEHAGENNLGRITTLFAAAARDGLLPLRALDGGFSATSHRVNEAYAQSADLVRYLRAQSPDPKTFPSLLTRIGEGIPFERALVETYGFDLDSLERAWSNDLRRRYPRIPIDAVMSLGWAAGALLVVAAFAKRIRRKRKRLTEMARREAAEDALRTMLEEAAAQDADEREPSDEAPKTLH